MTVKKFFIYFYCYHLVLHPEEYASELHAFLAKAGKR